jgi:hypothetical protein
VVFRSLTGEKQFALRLRIGVLLSFVLLLTSLNSPAHVGGVTCEGLFAGYTDLTYVLKYGDMIRSRSWTDYAAAFRGLHEASLQFRPGDVVMDFGAGEGRILKTS